MYLRRVGGGGGRGGSSVPWRDVLGLLGGGLGDLEERGFHCTRRKAVVVMGFGGLRGGNRRRGSRREGLEEIA